MARGEITAGLFLLAGVVGAWIVHSRLKHADGPTTTAVAPMHPDEISSFAVSRDGSLLATGSDGHYMDDKPEVGIVLWDVERGEPRGASIPVMGGIGLTDQLKRGLQFSASGDLLAFNYNTNQVGAIDVATHRIVLEAQASYNDSAPSFALSDDGNEVFIASSEECPDAFGSIAPSRGGDEAQLRCLIAPNLDGAHALSFRGGLVHVSDGDHLVSFDTTRQRTTRTMPLLRNHRPSLDTRFTLDVSPSGRLLAVSGAESYCGKPSVVGTELIDLDTGQRLLEDDEITDISGFVFDSAERRWAAVSAERRVDAPPALVSIFDGARKLGTIAGPFEPVNWLNFADGMPFAFSPDGTEALVVRPGGAIERWKLDPQPALIGETTTIAGANAILWPRRDRAVAIGPGVVAFLRMPSGAVVHRYDMPAAKP